MAMSGPGSLAVQSLASPMKNSPFRGVTLNVTVPTV
jgi:hypothetical protein